MGLNAYFLNQSDCSLDPGYDGVDRIVALCYLSLTRRAMYVPPILPPQDGFLFLAALQMLNARCLNALVRSQSK
jgi:hypothetical protein